MIRTATRTLLLAAVALLSACGSSSSPTPPPGGSTPNLFLQGSITTRTAGQIEVNGVTLTTPATVKIEGVERPETELHQGMVVRVKAHADATRRQGEALEVEFEDAVTGKVEARDATTLSVGGQTVRVDDATQFEDNSGRLASVDPGQRVRISGVPDDRGGLRATRIDKLSGTSDDFEVKGIVSDLTASGFTLKISPDAGVAGTFTVNLLGGATLPAGLANGSLVEVRSLKPVQAGQVIEASAIVIEDRLPGVAGGETEVEGIVTSGSSDSSVVAGTTVTTTSTTTWSGGVPGDLLPGAKVEAEGLLGSDGVLAAHKVSFRASSLLQGAVASLAVDGTGLGTLSVNGVVVTVDALTEQRDAAAGLADGGLVEVRGAPGRDGTSLVATRLQRTSDTRPIIRGLVTAKDATAGTLTILGKTIDTSSAEAFRGHSDVSGVDGPSMTAAEFFAAVTPGQTVVKARGRDVAAMAGEVALVCNGRNDLGQCGVAPTASPVLDRSGLAFGGTVLAASAGRAFTCALVGSPGAQVVMCWGANADGQLGRDTAPAAAPSPTPLPVGG